MELDFNLLKELGTVIAVFRENQIRYAVCGGFAVALYGYVRATKDIDLLCHPDDVQRAGKLLERVGYQQHTTPWTFQASGITMHRWMKPGIDELFYVVDLLVPPLERIDWLNAAREVVWGKTYFVRVVTKVHLCEMKNLRGSDTDKLDLSRLGEADE